MNRLAAMARAHQLRLLIVDRTVGGRYENSRTPEQAVPGKPLPYVWETRMTTGDITVQGPTAVIQAPPSHHAIVFKSR